VAKHSRTLCISITLLRREKKREREICGAKSGAGSGYSRQKVMVQLRKLAKSAAVPLDLRGRGVRGVAGV
jgi:hypothetical protein